MAKRLFWLLLIACPFVTAQTLPGKTLQVGPNDAWFEVLTGDQLQPGDEVVFLEGIYSDQRRLVLRQRGTAELPITIGAAANQRVVFRRPNEKQNTFNLEGTQFLILQGFEITAGASGIRIGPDAKGNQASDLVLQDLHIHHIGGVAVTCNYEGATYRRMVFRRNHIHHTSGHGEAFYLGANNAKAIFSDSVIENNYIHDLDGDNISQGDGIEIKHGSFGNRIANNIIHDTKYPGVTVYGTRGQARNQILNNVIWNTGDHGIQAAADAIIRGNFIAETGGCGIYSREHQGAVPNHLRIENNTVLASQNPAIRIIGAASSGAQKGTPTVEVVGNTLMGQPEKLCIRIENIRTVVAKDNRGVGDLTGSQAVAQSWTLSPTMSGELPKLPENPGSDVLNKPELQSLFERN